jgi:hypothetical protein
LFVGNTGWRLNQDLRPIAEGIHHKYQPSRALGNYLGRELLMRKLEADQEAPATESKKSFGKLLPNRLESSNQPLTLPVGPTANPLLTNHREGRKGGSTCRRIAGAGGT